GFCVRRADVQTWSFVLLMNFSNKLNFVLRNPPERKARKRCDAIRYAPCVTSFRRLSPPDALSRCADFVHQAVLQNFDLEQSSVETSQSRRNVTSNPKRTTLC